MSNLIDKGTIVERIDDLFFDNYPNPSKELETFYKEVLKIVINAKPQNNWISVKDRMPEVYEHVLVFSPITGIKNDFVAFVENDEEYRFFLSGRVTHWMPLPEPPKENDDE